MKNRLDKNIKARVSHELLEEIIEYCDKHDMTISDLVREAIKEYIA